MFEVKVYIKTEIRNGSNINTAKYLMFSDCSDLGNKPY